MHVDPDMLYQAARERQYRFQQQAQADRMAQLAREAAKVSLQPAMRTVPVSRRMLPIASKP